MKIEEVLGSSTKEYVTVWSSNNINRLQGYFDSEGLKSSVSDGELHVSYPTELEQARSDEQVASVYMATIVRKYEKTAETSKT